MGAVYQAIRNVMGALSKQGLGKDMKAPQAMGGYNYRGIDDLLNALSDKLVAHGLVILPTVLERSETQRESKGGAVLTHVALKIQYELIATEDASKHPIAVWGEGLDSGDKATNKAMSAAYKYMAFQVFCIPTLGMDSESDTVQHAPKPTVKKATIPEPTKVVANGNGQPGASAPSHGSPSNESGAGQPAPASGPSLVQGESAQAVAPTESDALETEIALGINNSQNSQDLAKVNAYAKEHRPKLTDAARARLKKKYAAKLDQLSNQDAGL